MPPLDKLSFESDFRDFMDTRVDDAVRRIALKKLFSDPRFNVKDGLDDYAENYAALEDLSADMVDKLQHARRTLRGREAVDSETPESRAAEQRIAQPAEPPKEPQPIAETGSAQDESHDPTGANETNERSG